MQWWRNPPYLPPLAATFGPLATITPPPPPPFQSRTNINSNMIPVPVLPQRKGLWPSGTPLPRTWEATSDKKRRHPTNGHSHSHRYNNRHNGRHHSREGETKMSTPPLPLPPSLLSLGLMDMDTGMWGAAPPSHRHPHLPSLPLLHVKRYRWMHSIQSLKRFVPLGCCRQGNLWWKHE